MPKESRPAASKFHRQQIPIGQEPSATDLNLFVAIRPGRSSCPEPPRRCAPSVKFDAERTYIRPAIGRCETTIQSQLQSQMQAGCIANRLTNSASCLPLADRCCTSRRPYLNKNDSTRLQSRRSCDSTVTSFKSSFLRIELDSDGEMQ